jgi:aldose 1-epimerase
MANSRFSDEALATERISAVIGGHSVRAAVQPRCGANLVSLEVDGHEYLFYDASVLRGPDEMYTGCFVMFPTPCRVPDGQYEFQGRKIKQVKHGRVEAIHGLVRDEAFAFSRTDASITLSLDITPGHPVYEGFPFPGRLTVAISLIERGVAYSFQYYNTGKTDAPVGFGLHPFWRIPGRGQTYIKVPCSKTVDLENLIPTGKATPVDGTPFDLRQPQCLAEMTVDNVWIGRSKEPAVLEFRDLGTRLTLTADDLFTHQIVYAPPGKPFVCLENLTCAPNAVNLQSAPAEVSGFRIVPPGGILAGTTRFVVEKI